MGQPAEGHRQVELAEDHLQHRFDALLAGQGEAPDVGAAEADGVGAECERLEEVGAAADAAVDEDRTLPECRPTVVLWHARQVDILSFAGATGGAIELVLKSY